MDLGFETIGNATLIVHDHGPVLVTDPWTKGSAYFGSWGLSHDVPEEQRLHAAQAQWVWFSHGHPDHLNPHELNSVKGRRVLVADHVGGRIASDLRRGGLDVTVLPDNRWTALSDRVRVLCLADYNQDSILLVDVGGRLVINMNDSAERGWGSLIRRVVSCYPISFLMRLSGYGDADMINFYDEQGRRLPSVPELRKQHGYQVGDHVARTTDMYRARYFVPFSSFHRYRRTDSAWANAAVTTPEDIAVGYRSTRSELTSAWIRYDCTSDTVEHIDPPAAHPTLVTPAEEGDDWAEELAGDEVRQVTDYFRRIEHLGQVVDFVTLTVGGREHTVTWGHEHGRVAADRRGITFEVPRGSLLRAVEWEIFDDLLIGNFMRTTLHGSWPGSGLAREVTPYVAKYADNGHARTEEELRAYFDGYRRRLGAIRYFRHLIERRAKEGLRSHLGGSSRAVSVATRTYQRIASHT